MEKEFYIGSVGPLLYDDNNSYDDSVPHVGYRGEVLVDDAFMLANGTPIQALNNAGNAFVDLIKLNSSDQVVLGAENADGVFVVGRAKAGSIITDSAAFGHYDHFTQYNTAILQTSAGITQISAPSGQSIVLHIGSSTAQATLNSTGLTLLGTLAIGGNFTSLRDSNGSVLWQFVNTNAGASNRTIIQVGNENNVSSMFSFTVHGTGFTTNGAFRQDGGCIVAEANLSGGISIVARASAAIRFYVGGIADVNKQLEIETTGVLVLGRDSKASDTYFKLQSDNGYWAGLQLFNGTSQQWFIGKNSAATAFHVNAYSGGSYYDTAIAIDVASGGKITLGGTVVPRPVKCTGVLDAIGVLQVVKITVSYNTADFTLVQVPANSVVVNCYYKCTTPWTALGGGSIQVGDATDPDGFGLFAGATTGIEGDIPSEAGAYLYDNIGDCFRRKFYTVATDILVNVTPGTASAGTGVLYFVYMRLE